MYKREPCKYWNKISLVYSFLFQSRLFTMTMTNPTTPQTSPIRTIEFADGLPTNGSQRPPAGTTRSSKMPNKMKANPNSILFNDIISLKIKWFYIMIPKGWLAHRTLLLTVPLLWYRRWSVFKGFPEKDYHINNFLSIKNIVIEQNFLVNQKKLLYDVQNRT